MITVYSTINLTNQAVPPIIPVVQGDTGRAIAFTLADFTIPAGATATYYVQKPSGEAVYNSAEISGNTVTVELTAQSIIEVGENNLQVRIILDEAVVTSFDVILMVRPFHGIGAVESETEMNIFDKAVEQATEDFQTNAEQIVEGVIESIPADYTELTEEVDELNERLPNVFSNDAKMKLLDCLNHMYWMSGNGAEYINALREALNASNRRQELPDTYEQVEYIYGNGNQWITFDFLSQIPFSVDAKMLYTRNDGNMIVANTNWSSDQSRRFMLLSYNNLGSGANTDIGMRVGNNPWTYSHGYDLNTIYKIQMGVYQTDNSYKAYVQVDDNERVETTLNNAPSLGYPMRLLKRDADSWVGRGAYFYSLVCYGGGSQKIFDGIPCYRRSDNVSGFYDAVTNTFYPSEGTSNFLIGPIVE